MDIMRKLSLMILLTYVAACGGGGGDTITQNPQILQTTTQSTDTDTSSQPTYSTTSRIGETGQIYVLERLSLGPEKCLSTWAAKPMTQRSHWIMCSSTQMVRFMESKRQTRSNFGVHRRRHGNGVFGLWR